MTGTIVKEEEKARTAGKGRKKADMLYKEELHMEEDKPNLQLHMQKLRASLWKHTHYHM